MAETSTRMETRYSIRCKKIQTRSSSKLSKNKQAFTSLVKPSRKERKPIICRTVPVTETKDKKKQNDSSNFFACEICVEKKMINEAFEIKGCGHSFCSECIVRYVASKVQENVISIGCPEMNCQGVLEPELCQSILPSEVFDRWGDALCEALILGPQKFYCPFKDCSALLVDECPGGEISESECPHCNRLFCAQCKVPWHAEITCADFQKLNADERGREDILLLNAVKKNNWQRCPGCKFYVERISGCPLIQCRCGHAFCYHCGSQRMNDHYCTVCHR
ncbi:hypothetical protein MKW94_012367 [Papaver nudicaule]|uniref:RBR-type E3 ubiquitin transferase n=1 Tax=Papaver nudicaule TaxID=74823 RepID=A0AA41VD00_PAPNU|nr:hypothetical protein [Papaver nudicaule]